MKEALITIGVIFIVSGILSNMLSMIYWAKVVKLTKNTPYEISTRYAWFSHRAFWRFYHINKFTKQTDNPELQKTAKQVSKYEILFIVFLILGLTLGGIGSNL